ncbi:DNA phosphorothioation system sulfurtransferase DndC, partial [Helicobacter cetorum]|uniref:DNA phosphorothioation system sulfurtransferase DndC n=1 Tax=Helicobacter cetorum TaxID=138563 RepID=UPI000CF0663A
PPNNHHQNLKILLACFSSFRTREMALKLENEFKNIDIGYLDGSLLELKDYALFERLDESLLTQIKTTKDALKKRYLEHKKAWVVAFSGGKDSSCVLQLLYELLCNLPKDMLNPTYTIVSNTLVESPVVEKYLLNLIESIQKDANARGLPFEVKLVEPNANEQFFTNLIGKGYPSPTRFFRWCTDRLKIRPAQRAIEQIIAKHGSCILLLGVRSNESSLRKKSVEKRVVSEEGFSKHDYYPNTLIYRPIVDWSLDDVWGYLSYFNMPKWNKSHEELFSLYSKASNDECQFILDTNTKSCGGSRFGCWVCTLVNEDKSLQGFIKNGETHLQPLNDFRNFIKEIREQQEYRSDFKKDGNYAPGPFTKNARMLILRRLLECEREYQLRSNTSHQLISDSELEMIAKIWQKEFGTEREFIDITKEFERMSNYQEEKVELLHSEIFEEEKIENSNLVKEIIKEAIKLSHGTDLGSLKAIIESMVDNHTNKIEEF